MRDGRQSSTVRAMSQAAGAHGRVARIQDRALVRDVILRDGSTLQLQASTPGDRDEIKAFYDGLSQESRFFRFRGYPRADLAARVEADARGVDRFALIGRHGGRVVACASYAALREKGVAEIAFAVADEYQHLGIGTMLLEQLAAIAVARGLHRFTAEVMAENRKMLGVFEHAGFAMSRVGSGSDVTVSLDITRQDPVTLEPSRIRSLSSPAQLSKDMSSPGRATNCMP